MAVTEITLLLKKARGAIDEKNYNHAVKYCKDVLKVDKENYNAWVFLAAAVQEIEKFEKAEFAFQKAIEISPDQILAWQGLASFYEKQKQQNKHIDVLMKMVPLLTNDKGKQLVTMEKLLTVSKSVEDKFKVIKILQLELEIIENDLEKEYKIWLQIFNELCKDQSLSCSCGDLQHTALEEIIESPLLTKADCKNILSIFTSPVNRNTFSEESSKLVKGMCLKFPDLDACLKFLLKEAVKLYITSGVVDENVKEVLSNAEGKNNLQLLCSQVQAIIFFIEKQYISAMKVLKMTIEKNARYLESWFLLSKIQLHIHWNKDAESNSTIGLKLAIKYSASDLIGYFYLFLGKALHGNKSWGPSLDAFEKSIKYLGKTEESVVAFCHALLEMGLVDDAKKMLSELSSSSSRVLQLEGYVYLLQKEYSEALLKLKESCKNISNEESAFSLHLIGRALFETNQPKKAFEIFLKAAEMDPFYFKNFLYLGQYYVLYEHDKKHARQCYQRAFDLDNSDAEVARCLSNLLKSIGDHEANFKVLKKVSKVENLRSCKWVWTTLGLYQLERNLINDAIISFQRQVRLDPLNSNIWQCLGDAYLKRRSYQSAHKSFQKSLDLEPKTVYSLYRVASIQKNRGLLTKAITGYENALHLDSTYTPGLIDLAETWFLLGKSNFKGCLYGIARDCLQCALNLLARVVAINVKLSSLWILAGNVCTFCFHLEERWFPVTIPSELLSQKESLMCPKIKILMFGSKFYRQALLLNNRHSSVWHNLGINLHFQSSMSQSTQKNNFAKLAFNCVQKAIYFSQKHHRYWNTLGVIASNKYSQDYALGQHAFIKSIELRRNNIAAWTNLGTLYLENGNIQLANKSFSVGQACNPSSGMPWIGQATVAYCIKHFETIDLYRHATTLSSHNSALLGYGRNICMTILDVPNRGTELYKFNVEEMNAIPAATGCLDKYTRNNNCPEAYMYYGILLERQELNGLALKAFERAVELFLEKGDTDNAEKSRINYARLLSTVGRNDESIAEYLKVKKMDMPLLCSFAFTLYKSGQFEKSSEMFERALDICPAADKSHVLVAMAMVSFKKSEAKKGVQLLVQSFQTKPSSAFGLLALYAISISRKDSSVAATIKEALRPLENNKCYSSSIAVLSAIEAYNKDGYRSARNVLMKAVWQQPDSDEIWMHVSKCLLHWNSSYETIVDTCAQISVFHGGSKEIASQLFALSKLSVGDKTMSLYAAQKAVHAQPDNLSNWVILAAACHVSGQNRNKIGWIFSFVKKLAKQQGIKTELLGWITVTEAYHYICCKEYSAANGLLKQVRGISTFGSKIASALQILHAFLNVLLEKDKVDPLLRAVKDHSKTFLGWQLLVNVLMKSQNFGGAKLVLSEFIIATSKFFPEIKVLPLLQIALLSYKAMKLSKRGNKWIIIGKNAISEVMKVSPKNETARFLQGLMSLETKNIQLTRRTLQKVSSVNFPEYPWVGKYSMELLSHICTVQNDMNTSQQPYWDLS